jgi:ubiquitin-protein ligase
MSNLLKSEYWLPSMTVKNILEHIWARLAVPDIDSNECDLIRAHSYKTDKERFETMAREYSIKYAQAI